MEDHGSIFTNAAVVSIEVSLGIEQEIGDVDREHQKQLPLAPVHRAIGAAHQQHEGWQHIEKRCEENAEVLDVSRSQACPQQDERGYEMAWADSVKAKQGQFQPGRPIVALCP